ncbi:uncharacterized protein (DUF1800 family) [Limimaricola soesokkakensis]|uniref:Uncharacterized protein (DUF1800 family) n=1 Tax=Limimaricola soesokkakensis TaxID=1343159 RepID=A0A1X6Z8M1_9RHOB|nr:DUF1800 domain-containing protein [Limimaricola soesokkakensis]PSK86731.1 uncharacterized protein (DUF1800 family) [Limimaricola soesokkakensis]SLN42013.1 hypothetical protein LOS8367_01790 [Limimaricola soesokkakensis]
MPFDPLRAAIRFGTGLSPVQPPPESVAAMLRPLSGRDEIARQFPIPSFGEARPTLVEWYEAGRAKRAARGSAQEKAARDAQNKLSAAARALAWRNFATSLARGVAAPEGGLHERLVRFWADHFTTRAQVQAWRHLITPYVEEAIRPRVAAPFEELLIAVTTHPAMLAYLDQARSTGPNSRAGRRGGGLNENLARELLELHTVGVDGPYDQTDVRELAELLTGLSWSPARGLEYRPDRAEPGAETVLGTTFSDRASFDTIREALRMLARHPATARHMARKIAVHFVADDPDEALVATLETVWRDSRGDLLAVTATLLEHPAAWAPEPRKIKQPYGFVQSALRALGVAPQAIAGLGTPDLRRQLYQPLMRMGQPWERPPGPDGWSEAAEAWVTPHGMAARIDWAMNTPSALLDDLPDPRAFVRVAVGADAPEALVFAARAAESRAEAIGVVLSSPAFQRR